MESDCQLDGYLFSFQRSLINSAGETVDVQTVHALFNHCSRTTENFRVAEVAMLSYGKPAD